ncbi:phosphatase PAP2 family protein [Salinibaculum rarum]|uniref:phosphatase PAP2 family protein n=1 Tax=Salinibaculum rarum TaxID=3058903 RepID=UPI00265E203F|nr:phosphatase PAP2 family protein [Salinibaculum sp. KK48]
MYRFQAVSEVIREGVPPALTDLFVLITELGGLPFLLVALSVLYWVDDRPSTATVISYTLVALVATLALKQLFMFPRPPVSVQAVAEQPETSGFPSGHAISATVVYGGLVLARERLRDARFVGGAVAVIGLVGLSRIVIGVHYLGDVLAGYAVGGAILAGLWLTVGKRPAYACLVATVAAALTFPLTAGSGYALIGLGGSIGATATFWTSDTARLPHPETIGQTAVLVIAGLAFAGGMFWLAETVPFAPAAVLASAVLVAGILLFPRLLETAPFEALAV